MNDPALNDPALKDPALKDPAQTRIEELLRRDRAAASFPEPPDVRYTVAAVRHKLGQATAAMEHRPGDTPAALPRRPGHTPARPRPDVSTDWPLLLIAAATPLVGGGVALTQGLNPWWLLALPLSVLPLFPILMRKGV